MLELVRKRSSHTDSLRVCLSALKTISRRLQLGGVMTRTADKYPIQPDKFVIVVVLNNDQYIRFIYP